MAVRRITIVSVCACSLWLIAGGLPRSAAAEIPEQVRQALESNVKSLSPITVAWERTRTSDLPRPRVLSLLRQETNSMFLPQKSRVMWDNGQFYTKLVNQSVQVSKESNSRNTGLADAPVEETQVELTFDGQKRTCRTKFIGGTSPPIVVTDTPENLVTREPRTQFFIADFFYQAGFHFPETAEDFAAKRSAISLPLYLVEQGAHVVEVGREKVDGVDCTALVLRSETAEDQFVLDPAKGYAVRRHVEKTPSGEVAVRIDCSNFTQVSDSGLWIPKKVEVEWHTWRRVLPKPVKEAVVRETYSVSELKYESIPPAEFVLNYNDPGTIVSDGTLEGKKNSMGRVSYHVPADPRRLDEVIKAAASGDNYQSTIVSFRRNFILANVLLILILIGVAWWRVRRKSL